MNSRPVIVSYSGVHQAFQIALAAREAGLLDTFYTSFFDAPGKWGRRLARVLGHDALANRRLAGLASDCIVEYPWPELVCKLRGCFSHSATTDWIIAAHKFDHWVSKQIQDSESRIFVGVENCAYHSFQVAKEQGMKLVYDCPGFNARQTQAAAGETARRFGLNAVSVGDTPEMEHRKEHEIHLADHVLCCSEVHAESLQDWGVTPEKTVICPLWIDSSRWFPPSHAIASSVKLRVLYAGGITLRKGIPYLLEAARKIKNNIELTMVGLLGDDVRSMVDQTGDWLGISPPVSKMTLRQIYWQNDVLVLPSLGDSFGFVALEAMACGLPVIVTDNCGVPVPVPAWRVPIMDSDAIAARLEYYVLDREALQRDGQMAAEFARQFTPERYREQIKRLLKRLLSNAQS